MRCILSEIVIDAADIIRRLQDFALGDDPSAMTDAQVAGSLVLLDQIMPDLAGVQIEMTAYTRHPH